MGHIFISYSHKDTEYAHALSENLQSMGFNTWIDGRLDYGSQWPLEIQTQLDACDAFIVIMTPRAFTSEWVQSELQRAKRKRKPIFPLLLEGDEPWLSVESTQFYDVRGEKLPDTKFYSAIRRVVSITQTDTTLRYVKGKIDKTGSSSDSVKPKMSTEVMIALIGAGVTIITACATIIFGPLVTRWVNDGGLFPPQEQATQNSGAGDSSIDATQAPVESGSDATEGPLSDEFVDDFGVSMRLVSDGEFTMGLSADTALEMCLPYDAACQRDWFTDEEPVRQVYLDAFYMDVYEVTNALYRDCVKAGDCYQPAQIDSPTRPDYFYNPEFNNYPVIHVDWEMAQNYCNWRGAQLPTEAQWEKAARGTDGYLYPWGNEIDTSFANYAALGAEDTMEAGDFENGQSPYGLFDMAGNVWEWVADWYGDSYYQFSPLSNPPGPEDGQFHVVRGGSWADTGFLLRTSVRGRDDPTVIPDNGFGFRCARPLP